MASDNGQSSQARPYSPAQRGKRLWELFRRYWRGFAVGALFLVATNILTFRVPRELGLAIQALRDAERGTLPIDDAHASVATHALIIILLSAVAAVTRILSRTTIFNGGRAIEYDLRNAVFRHLTRLSPAYYQGTPTGDLTSRVTNDTTYVRLLYGMGFLHGVNTIVAVAIAVGLMAGLDTTLTLYCLAPFPPVLAAVFWLAKELHHQTRRVQEKLAEMTSQVQEDISGIAVVKAYAIEDVEARRFDGVSEEYVQENLRLSRIRGWLFALMTAIGGLGTLLVLYFGGRAVIAGDITLGNFIEFTAYVALLAWPFMALGWVMSVWQRGTAAFDRVQEILATVPDIQAPLPSPTAPAIERGQIEFRGVSFQYPGTDDEVLRDIDLTIRAGSKVAIVGRSGSGKTSLVALIPRLYDVTRGEIRIDGHPIRDIPLERLRGAIGYAPQEPFLFSTTLAKNIRLGVDADQPPDTADAGESSDTTPRPSFDHAPLQPVIDAVQLTTDLTALPDGLDTMVGERGITLSGGQKQRAALARALVTTPRVLILDDSLSSVDTRTERAILDHLEAHLRGRTAIVVTHRFSILELMDEIVVLDRGRIAERGSHAALLARPEGVYAAMVRRQKLKEEMAEL